MLNPEEVTILKKAVSECKRPLIFFHDDPDGFASFIMFYHEIGAGKGFVVKAVPTVTEYHLRKVQEYQPDAIFILDLANVDQIFLDQVNVPVYWIDHHAPQDRKKVNYFNPRISNDVNVPTPALCYQVTEKDLWLATVGCVGDWYLPPFVDEFRKKYPELLPETITRVEDAYFDSPITPLVKALSFNLKGTSSDVTKSIKTMLKIESPYEILNQTTSRGRLIWKRYDRINKEFERMLEGVEKSISGNDPLIVYTYTDNNLSLTRDLANEIIYRYPDRALILGRRRGGEVKCSLRGQMVNIPPILEEALKHVRGGGGGHEHACGAHIDEHDFDRFIELYREGVVKQLS